MVAPRGCVLLAVLAFGLVSWPAGRLSAGGLDEFRVTRQEPFEFAARPTVAREGDQIKISFSAKAFCDATVAIENGAGKIVRHLASGVLGANAPAPFQQNSLSQAIVWDGKNDKGEYVDDRTGAVVRVSLGLEPRFERTLFWSPHKRISECTTLVRAAPEGVYVYDGQVLDHLRLFDHQGKYIRTVYPFPANKLESVRGLTWRQFAQTGAKAVLKGGYHQAGLLTSGSNNNPGSHEEGQAAFAMAVRGERIALAMLKLNRLGTDGSSGGLPLEGPATSLTVSLSPYSGGDKQRAISPWSVELSPDGKRLYLAGYGWTYWDVSKWDCLSGVMQMDYEGGEPAKLFAGSIKPYEFGAGDGQFHCATSVACDARGRVYVSDYMNDRIQVFSPEGKLLKSVAAARPAVVRVHQKSGEIFVFSWPVHNVELTKETAAGGGQKVTPRLTRLGPLENPAKIAEYPLPLPMHGNWWAKHPPGPMYCGEIDSWSEPVTIWISTLRGRAQERGLGSGGDGFGDYGRWEQAGLKALVIQDGKLVPRVDFGKETMAEVARAVPPIIGRQRLYVNPKTGRVYVAEGDSGVMKSVNQLVELDAETGRVALVDLPLGAEDLCFDVDGQLYLRTDTVVARYDPRNWREIPFDYGEERDKHSYGMGAREANLSSGLVTPGHRSFNFWHLGGIDVSARGHIVVTTCNGSGLSEMPKMGPQDAVFGQGARKDQYGGKPYAPQIYPGRMRWGEIHIWDQHGQPVYQDAVPGMGHLNGIGIDRNDNLYMLAASRRLIDGKPIDPGLDRDVSGTLVKVAPAKAKVLSAGGAATIPVPLADDARPHRPMDMTGYTTGWVEGAQWFYGGVGFCTPGKCVCWNCRFSLDYFGRSFAPEPLTFSVAVLDSNGNVVCRVGRYGNADDGIPLVRDGGPANTQAIGGDEVGLMYACYVATHTDRRLFIADPGNGRVVSVKLNYHATERVELGGKEIENCKMQNAKCKLQDGRILALEAGREN